MCFLYDILFTERETTYSKSSSISQHNVFSICLKFTTKISKSEPKFPHVAFCVEASKIYVGQSVYLSVCLCLCVTLRSRSSQIGSDRANLHYDLMSFSDSTSPCGGNLVYNFFENPMEIKKTLENEKTYQRKNTSTTIMKEAWK